MTDRNDHKRGILLVNLGSPASTAVGDVRRYLRQFLMDERVLDIPWFARAVLVNGIIAPFRAGKSAEAYREIWTAEGSPLIVNTRRLAERLAAKVDPPVAIGMRYQSPSIADGIRDLISRTASMDELLLVPLYPHYAMSTYETVVEDTKIAMRRLCPQTKLSMIPPFFNDPRYIKALAASVRESTAEGFDHLLFSYHGLPVRHLRKTDPTGLHCFQHPDCCSVASGAFATCYRAQAYATTAALTRELDLKEGGYTHAFQSRFGKDTWLEPFTDAELRRLGREGVRRLAVICPAFTADCLETLEEIGIRGKADFLSNGGGEFHLIPCLNDHPLFVEALANWCEGSVVETCPPADETVASM